jgi:hypothetical protein
MPLDLIWTSFYNMSKIKTMYIGHATKGRTFLNYVKYVVIKVFAS